MVFQGGFRFEPKPLGIRVLQLPNNPSSTVNGERRVASPAGCACTIPRYDVNPTMVTCISYSPAKGREVANFPRCHFAVVPIVSRLHPAKRPWHAEW